MLVQSELVEVLRKNYSYTQLNSAFKDPRVMQSIQKHVQNKNIQLRHHTSNEPICEDEMELIGEKGPEQALICTDFKASKEEEAQIERCNLVSVTIKTLSLV